MKNIIINLKQPYWNAYARYSWQDGVEGFGISEEKVNKARDLKVKIIVKYKDTSYIISPVKAILMANKYRSRFVARDGTKLLVIPRSSFKRLPDEESTPNVFMANPDRMLKMREDLRKKGFDL